VTVAVAAPTGAQEYVNGATPPEGTAVAVPSFRPLQVTSVCVRSTAKLPTEGASVAVALAEQLLTAETVTVRSPGPTLECLCSGSAGDQ
jgi:hypothetical protein